MSCNKPNLEIILFHMKPGHK